MGVNGKSEVISTKLHTKYHNQGLMQAITFLAICQKLQKLWHLDFLLTQDHMGLEISKGYFSQSLLWIPSTLGMWTLLITGECRLIRFLASGQVLQNLWYFEILTYEPMGNPKMWNISKTVDRRTKRTKMWDSGVLQCTFVGYFGCPIAWVWFGIIVCTLQNFQFYHF